MTHTLIENTVADIRRDYPNRFNTILDDAIFTHHEGVSLIAQSPKDEIMWGDQLLYSAEWCRNGLLFICLMMEGRWLEKFETSGFDNMHIYNMIAHLRVMHQMKGMGEVFESEIVITEEMFGLSCVDNYTDRDLYHLLEMHEMFSTLADASGDDYQSDDWELSE